jgi:hypothetical protein
MVPLLVEMVTILPKNVHQALLPHILKSGVAYKFYPNNPF